MACSTTPVKYRRESSWTMDKARKRKAAHTGQPFGGQTLASGINDKYIHTHRHIHIHKYLIGRALFYILFLHKICVPMVCGTGRPPNEQLTNNDSSIPASQLGSSISESLLPSQRVVRQRTLLSSGKSSVLVLHDANWQLAYCITIFFSLQYWIATL